MTPPAYLRWLASAGLETRRAGPTARCADGGRVCVMITGPPPRAP